MDKTGMVRKIDELGRIVLPVEIRRTLGIGERDRLLIRIEENEIILKKFEPMCIFCGENRSLVEHKGKTVCPACIREMNSAK